ncbi:MAG: hypothetical protein P8N54_00060 [Flavobacteriales bacterium]|jgi:hypothetical protein|nr:hypothetical protein [Flavobacteriales bacterium]MDG1395789.1 hypothetical protein [Flavobacteriales bacterium]|tara:strand:- start:1199 stop:1528 length:330 start_codon:yes stop_codon:yes gene_type:complete
MEDFITNYGIVLTYILLGVAAFLALAFPIKQLISQPKKAKQIGIALGGLLVIYIIATLLASDEVSAHYAKFGVTESISKQVGTGLFLFYILGAGAIAAVIYAEVSKMLK